MRHTSILILFIFFCKVVNIAHGSLKFADEFQPNQSSTDDEETIAKAEEDFGVLGHVEEVEMLKRESELPLEDLLKELPDDYLENRDKLLDSEKSEGGDDVSSRGDDDEFTVASDKDSTDDEETIQEQEAVEGKVDHKKELEDLQVRTRTYLFSFKHINYVLMFLALGSILVCFAWTSGI